MPKFTVTRLIDAYVKSSVEVEAATAMEARDLARSYEFKGEWSVGDTIEYDETIYGVEDEAGEEVIEPF